MLSTIGRAPAKRPTELVDLLMECHERIRYFVALAAHIGSHPTAADADCVEACARVERYFTEALPLHVADEEDSILPRLRGRTADVDRALATMEAQHADHEPLLRELLRLSRQVREQPADRDRRVRLKEAADVLGGQLDEHLALEEAVIFPAIRRLSAEIQAAIVDELRSRRTVATAAGHA